MMSLNKTPVLIACSLILLMSAPSETAMAQTSPAAKGVSSKTGAQAVSEPSGPVKDIQSEADFSQWCTYYYLYPRPDLTPKALLFAEKSGLFDKGTAQAVLLAVAEQVFEKNPKQLSAWIKELSSMKTAHKVLIWKALWQANTAESRQEANILAQQFPVNGRPPALTDSSPKPHQIVSMQLSPQVLDMLWASFFITGEPRYVERIISSLPGIEKGQADINKSITGAAAGWSLSANARQHKRVMEICKKAETTHPEWKSELEIVLAKAGAQH